MAAEKRKRWKYFYYNGHLHKTITSKRSIDEIYAERSIDGQRLFLSYSDVMRNGKKCWPVSEVAKVMGVNADVINRSFREGQVVAPEFSRAGKNKHFRYLEEKHIAELVRFFTENRVGGGKPRTVIAKTLGEIMLELEEGIVLYTKTRNGNFIPVWKAEEW